MAKPRSRLSKFLYDNSLSLVILGLFLLFLIGLGITGYLHENETLVEHGQAALSFQSYLVSGSFFEAVFENWESEFLQMWAFVVLTIFLHQKGSADSKRLRGREPVDTKPRYSILHATSWRTRRKAIAKAIYANSLGLALLGLFIMSFVLHVFSGVSAFNEEALQHGQSVYIAWQYVSSSQFWFESFQNWQSEFLAVGALTVLSIHLRQRGSPESKPVGAPDSETGEK